MGCSRGITRGGRCIPTSALVMARLDRPSTSSLQDEHNEIVLYGAQKGWGQVGREGPASRVSEVLTFTECQISNIMLPMMSKHEFLEYLSSLKLSFSEAAQFLGVSERTARRWTEGESVPGPVEAALKAWRRLDDQGLPWKPDSISIFRDDQDQLRRMREHDQLLDTLMRQVEARGGPSTYWAVDLAKQRATFGSAEVSFHKLQQGGFSPSAYRRVDRAPTEEDRCEIQDACYCIAQAIARARLANKALVEIAEYTRQHATKFARERTLSLDAAEATRRVEAISQLADELNELASSALEGNALYVKFEGILDALHRLGFFPEQELVSAVARSMIGPAPRPDTLTATSP